jgi:hypothetical protein
VLQGSGWSVITFVNLPNEREHIPITSSKHTSQTEDVTRKVLLPNYKTFVRHKLK